MCSRDQEEIVRLHQIIEEKQARINFDYEVGTLERALLVKRGEEINRLIEENTRLKKQLAAYQ